MKRAVLGISLSTLMLLGVAPQLSAAEAEDTGVSSPNPTASPASIEELKLKIDAMNAQATRGLEEVVRLVQAGVEKTVIETYVRNSGLPAPTPNDLIYLHEKGVPQEVVTALIEHGREQQKAAQNAAPVQGANATALGPGQTDPSAGGAIYNNYLVTSPNSTMSAAYSPSYTTPNNNLLIIPYQPYRNYYQSYYSSPFYSYGYGGYGGYGGYPWGWNYWDSYWYNPPHFYSFGHRPYSYFGPSHSFGFRGGFSHPAPAPLIIGRSHSPSFHGGVGPGPGPGGGHRVGSGPGLSFGGRPAGGGPPPPPGGGLHGGFRR